MAATPSVPSRILRNPSFQRLWIGSVVSSLGAAVGGVVLTWIVFTTSHSPLAVALLGIVSFLPTAIFGLLAGALIDRFDRRRLLIACDVARFAVLGGLAGYTWIFGVTLPVILAAALVVATFSTIFRPATNALIPRLAAGPEMADANGVLLAGVTVAGFLGSPVGGLMVVTVGIVGGLLANAVTYGFSAAMIFLMVIPPLDSAGAAASTGSLLGEVREGLRYLRGERALLRATLSGMVANLFLSMYFAFVVIYAADQLHQAATGFGLLLAAGAGGFALGGLLPGRLGAMRAPGLWYAAAWSIAGLSIVGLALTTNLAVAVVASVGFGVFGGLGNTTFISAVQSYVPPTLLGRYLATDEAGSFALIPAGQVIGGVLILEFGVGATFLVAGLGSLACSGVLLLMPSVRAWGRTPTPALT